MKLTNSLKQQIATALAGFDVRSAVSGVDRAALKQAAVAVAITDAGHGAALDSLPEHTEWNTDGALILTRRSAKLRNHSGQWALPGGRLDDGETPEQAALRELREEVDLHCPPDAIMGRLDDVVTRSGFSMTPIVIWAGPAREIRPNPDEVASIHRIPISELLRDDAPMLTETDISEHPELRMPIGQSWIAAPTASVLYQFRELCLLGRTTRVDRFEQPRFTWR